MSANVIHSLWMVILAGVASACAVSAVVRIRRRAVTRRRAAALFGREPAAAVRAQGFRACAGRLPGARDWLPTAGAGAAGIILLGGAAGCAAGLAAAYGMWRWRRRRKRADSAAEALGQARSGEAERQLPLAADLMAACLAAGAGPREAAEAVGLSLGGPVGERLARAAAEVRLGGDPATAWGRLGGLPGARGLARCLERAQATGVPAVEPMSRLAGRLRAERGRAAGIRARRAGVLATAPLGLCFLPAFLTVGVVPVVIGLASGLTKGH
ncbi:type II secretion system F family protein [Streptomyces roseoverticillatus]|uniref:type II secretion system F family protein n=1 Tax=Streptomyces roseoverticillatus TaxID=66429 RepID=UPI001F3C42AC|nr:type II secretion system F family protein [Streptomyces roseoverticillatus]MCF3100439.1 type II secretion system F family protein [Streptomyces roseoverticillatus]